MSESSKSRKPANFHQKNQKENLWVKVLLIKDEGVGVDEDHEDGEGGEDGEDGENDHLF